METERRHSVGERIRAVRLRKGLTQAQVAGDDISVAFLSRIEAGTRTPSRETLESLARRLEIPVAQILPESEAEITVLEENLLRTRKALTDSEWNAAARLAREILPRAREIGAADIAASALWALGEATVGRGDFQKAIKFYEQSEAEDRYASLEDRMERIVARARTYRLTRDFGISADLLEGLLAELGEEARLYPRLAARICSQLGATCDMRGDLNRARQVAQMGLDYATMADDTRTLADALWVSANELRGSDPERALIMARKALALYEDLGFQMEIGRLLGVIGHLKMLLLDWEGAKESLEKGIALNEHDAPSIRAVPIYQLAEVEVKRRDPDAAISLALRAIKVAGKDRRSEGHARRVLGVAHLAKGSLEAAEQELRRAAQLLRSTSDPSDAAACLRDLGGLYLKQGRQLEAIKSFQDALALVTP